MKKGMMKRVLKTTGLLVLATMSDAVQSVSAAEKSGQSLSPETEMAIMRVMNLENRIQTLQTVPAKMTGIELAGHFSGTWINLLSPLSDPLNGALKHLTPKANS